MVGKKGQITIFFVIGIVILVIFTFILNIQKDQVENFNYGGVTQNNEDSKMIKNYVESCLKYVSEEGLWKLGMQGGYINPEGDSFYGEDGADEFYKGRTPSTTYINSISVPYYLDSQSYEVSYPSLDEIEKKLERYIIVEFEKCLDLSTFEKQGFEVIAPIIDYHSINFNLRRTKVDSNVIIGLNEVNVILEYPLNFKKEGYEFMISNFKVDIPIRFGELYNAAILLSNNIYNSYVYYDVEPECYLYDTNDLTNLFYKKSDYDYWDIIQLVDYSTYESKYVQSYIFQFAIKNIGFVGECHE
jgi:hypothetical protein